MKKWLTAKEAAEELDMAVSTFYGKFKDSESLKAVHDGQRIEITVRKCHRLHGRGFYYQICKSELARNG